MIGKVNIPREGWLRGNEMSTLLCMGSKRKQCCVGLLSTQMGVPDAEILDKGTVSSNRATVVWHLLKHSGALYGINDDPTLSNEKREECLEEMFSRSGLQTNFYDKEIDFQL